MDNFKYDLDTELPFKYKRRFNLDLFEKLLDCVHKTMNIPIIISIYQAFLEKLSFFFPELNIEISKFSALFAKQTEAFFHEVSSFMMLFEINYKNLADMNMSETVMACFQEMTLVLSEVALPQRKKETYCPFVQLPENYTSLLAFSRLSNYQKSRLSLGHYPAIKTGTTKKMLALGASLALTIGAVY